MEGLPEQQDVAEGIEVEMRVAPGEIDVEQLVVGHDGETAITGMSSTMARIASQSVAGDRHLGPDLGLACPAARNDPAGRYF